MIDIHDYTKDEEDHVEAEAETVTHFNERPII